MSGDSPVPVPGTAAEVRALNDRLDQDLLAEASAFHPDRLHDAPEGEWSAAQVLAHLGEFPRFFAAELGRWRAEPDTGVGRTHEHPVRLAAVADPAGDLATLIATAKAAFAELAEALAGLSDADLAATMQNVKYGSEPVTAFLDRYVLGHKSGHLDQLRALAGER